jgi:hypothetical protein
MQESNQVPDSPPTSPIQRPAWTLERVLALAPDAASASSGKGLSNLFHWRSSGQSATAIWGECKGSGKNPYQTRVAWGEAEPSFKCSCPSRKFPCKHGLGLMLMFAAAPGQIPQAEPPPWVQEWLDSRESKKEAKAEKAAQADDPLEVAKREKAAQKRQNEKEKRLEAGMLEFGLWLRDLVRSGFASVQSWGYDRWETAARRLVDAGAAGAARKVRDLAGIASSGEGWQSRLLERLALLHLLVEGFQNREALPEGAKADLLQTLGWVVTKEEVLALPAVQDHWLVLGSRTTDLDTLRERRSYLRGLHTGRDALILEFSYGSTGFETSLPLGHTLEADLHFFPSTVPFRAIVGLTSVVSSETQILTGNTPDLLERYSVALAGNPWLERLPALLGPVHLTVDALIDQGGNTIPLTPQYPHIWHLLAHSGGHPVTLAGEWDGEYLYPMGVWTDSGFYGLGGGA